MHQVPICRGCKHSFNPTILQLALNPLPTVPVTSLPHPGSEATRAVGRLQIGDPVPCRAGLGPCGAGLPFTVMEEKEAVAGPGREARGQ